MDALAHQIDAWVGLVHHQLRLDRARRIANALERIDHRARLMAPFDDIHAARRQTDGFNRLMRPQQGRTTMGKLGSIAERIAQKKAAHDAKAEEWGARLDAMDAREPEAFRVGDAVIAERDQDLASMERDLRQLSNLPLADPSPKRSGEG